MEPPGIIEPLPPGYPPALPAATGPLATEAYSRRISPKSPSPILSRNRFCNSSLNSPAALFSSSVVPP
jgi:hypothetical protein